LNSSIGGTLDEITSFIGRSTGLRFTTSGYRLRLYQLVDKKELELNISDVNEVIHRKDSEDSSFLQLNFLDGRKILITDQLIGFKPHEVSHLDMKKIPRVVTTPDLLNVIDAIEESIECSNIRKNETEMLKRVYIAILKGAESIGFNTVSEKELYHNLVVRKLKGSA
jgi:hypothetical protein